MDKYLYNKLRRLYRPGRGKQMKAEALQQFLVKALTERPKDLETEFKVCHGVAVRAKHKLDSLNLTTREQIESLTPSELHQKWYAKSNNELKADKNQPYLQPDYARMQDLYITYRKNAKTRSDRKTAPNRSLIIDEVYFSEENRKKAQEQGYSLYSKSHVYKEWSVYAKNDVDPEYRKQHELGAAAELDFNGPTIAYTDSEGNQKQATVIGLALPASSKFEARAINSQKLEDVIPALIDMFKSLGGVTKTIVVDNFKGAVTTPSLYGGTINKTFDCLCRSLGIEAVTCRPYCPTDKGCVEAHMKIVSNRIIAKAKLYESLKGKRFTCLKDVDDFVKAECVNINNTAIRGLNLTRNQRFEEEKAYLKQPNSWDFKLVNAFNVKVPFTCNLLIENHLYSVDSRWCNVTLTVELHQSCVKIYHLNQLLVVYKRKDNEPGLSTQPYYTSDEYLSYAIFEPEQKPFLLEWAEHIGIHVKQLCMRIYSGSNTIGQKNRLIHKLLTLPKANKDNYGFLDTVAEDYLCQTESAGVGKVINQYNELQLPSSGTNDDIYNDDNYKKIIKDVLFDKTEAPTWPKGELIVKPSTGSNEKNYYLNGPDYLQQKYASIRTQIGNLTSTAECA